MTATDYQRNIQYYSEWAHHINYLVNTQQKALISLLNSVDLLTGQVEILDRRLQRMIEKLKEER